MSALPAGPFSVVMKKPISLREPSEVLCTEAEFRFGIIHASGIDWQFELPYSEIESLDSSRDFRGIVTGKLKDGRDFEFRLKSAGPRKELAKLKALEAVVARIGATGSLRPIDVVLVMPSEPPRKHYTALDEDDALLRADEDGVGEYVRRFMTITKEGGFFLSGFAPTIEARVGGDHLANIDIEWKADGTVMLNHTFGVPLLGEIGTVAQKELGKPKLIRDKLRSDQAINARLDVVERFIVDHCVPES